MRDSWITRRWKRCVSVRCAVFRTAKTRKLLRVFLGSIVPRSMGGWHSIDVVDGER